MESKAASKVVILAAVWRVNWEELREDRGTVSEIWKLLLWHVCKFVELAESPKSQIILQLFSF